MVQQVGTEAVVPAHAEDVAQVGGVVISRVKARQRGRTVQAGFQVDAVPAVVSGQTVLLGKDVVAFDTEFVPGIQRQSLRDEIIRLHISSGSRDYARVGNQLASRSRLVDAENFRGE